jgi:hypothetical protein
MSNLHDEQHNDDKKGIGPLSKQIDETVALLQAQGFNIKAIFDCHVVEDAQPDDPEELVGAQLVNVFSAEGCDDYYASIPKAHFPQNKWTRFDTGTIFFMFIGEIPEHQRGKKADAYGIDDLLIVPQEAGEKSDSFVLIQFSTAVWTQEMIDEVNRKAEEMYAFFQQGKAKMKMADDIEENNNNNNNKARPEIQTHQARTVHVTIHDEKNEDENK